jgi:hypothetical protein
VQQPRGAHRKLCSRGVVPAMRTVDPEPTFLTGPRTEGMPQKAVVPRAAIGPVRPISVSGSNCESDRAFCASLPPAEGHAMSETGKLRRSWSPTLSVFVLNA